ncbi:MAG TPA: RNA ligase [Solirubrobacteraceae bacterium]
MSQFDRERLDALVADGWLRSQRHPQADLWIYSYTEKTQYESHWTPETLLCRGLILDQAGGVIARPFPKFFNYGDPQVPSIPDESFIVMEKMDGSLGILYYLDGLPCIATRSSFTSRQAIEGTAMLSEQDLERLDGVTALFEIVYPSNRIVVDYGDRRELILLAAICHETGLDRPLPSYSGPVVQRYGQIEIDTLAAQEERNREGFVVVFESGLRVKVKFAEYLRLHKIVTGVSARMIWESMRDGDDLDGLLLDLPDEIHRWISHTRASIQAAFEDELGRACAVFEHRPASGERKSIAQYFAASDANTAVLFRMLDEKPFHDLIWKAIRPAPSTPQDPPPDADHRPQG